MTKAALEILRLDYGIGQGMWADTSVVANEITITIDIQHTLSLEIFAQSQ